MAKKKIFRENLSDADKDRITKEYLLRCLARVEATLEILIENGQAGFSELNDLWGSVNLARVKGISGSFIPSVVEIEVNNENECEKVS